MKQIIKDIALMAFCLIMAVVVYLISCCLSTARRLP